MSEHTSIYKFMNGLFGKFLMWSLANPNILCWPITSGIFFLICDNLWQHKKMNYAEWLIISVWESASIKSFSFALTREPPSQSHHEIFRWWKEWLMFGPSGTIWIPFCNFGAFQAPKQSSGTFQQHRTNRLYQFKSELGQNELTFTK